MSSSPSHSPSQGPGHSSRGEDASVDPIPVDPISADPTGNAVELYGRISADPELTQSLFRQALQDPSGALDRIVGLGAELDLPVSREEVKAHIAALDDPASKQWLLKARGGL
ncbi:MULTISPECIES: hypothetical protein [Aphanothece]|uniref:hypothetical protein n=1 Tax=Aphanothece TaxID=1121 RepID=UPI0039848ECD